MSSSLLSIFLFFALFESTNLQSTSFSYLQAPATSSTGTTMIMLASNNIAIVGTSVQADGSKQGVVTIVKKDGTMLSITEIGEATDDELEYGISSDGATLLMVGNTRSFGAQGLDGWLSIFNTLTLTEKNNFIFGGSADDYLKDVIVTSDNGYALAGYTKSGIAANETEFDAWIIKLDTNLNIIWEQRYQGGNNTDDRAHSIIESSDNNLIFVGVANKTGLSKPWVVKLQSSDGTVIFDVKMEALQEVIDGNKFELNSIVRPIEPSKTFFLAYGTQWSPSGDPTPWLVNLTSTGTIIHKDNLFDVKIGEGTKIQAYSDNMLLLTGRSKDSSGDTYRAFAYLVAGNFYWRSYNRYYLLNPSIGYGMGWFTDDSGNSLFGLTGTVEEGGITKAFLVFTQPCQPGEYFNDKLNNCYKCIAGTYQEKSTIHTSCDLCPAGTASTLVGSTLESNCGICDIGTASEKGSTTCTFCKPGFYEDTKGQEKCKACPAGTFNPNTGSVDISVCDICTIAYYSNEGQGSCTICPKGTYNNQTNQPYCSKCPAGMDNDNLGSIYYSDCSICNEGTYADQAGTPKCKDCLPGYYEDTKQSIGCKACLAAFYNPLYGRTDISSCLPCPIGTASNKIGIDKCPDCDKGTYQNNIQQLQCIKCDIGKANPNTGSSDPNDCALCVPGKYADVTGLAECKKCPKGKYQNTFGQGSCIDCDFGTYQSSEGMTSCIDCSPGNYQNVKGKDNCILCLEGTYTPAYRTNICTNCDIGYKCPTKGLIAEQQCEVGAYQDKPAQASCTKCPAGTSSNLLGSISLSNCQPCLKGSYAVAGSTTCTSCELGRYQPSDAQGSCLKCEAGKYQDFTGQTSCNLCSAGTSNPYLEKTNIAACVICDAGTISGQAASSCTSCPPGRFQSGSDHINCQSCPKGTYQTQYKQTSCVKCPAGTYNTIIGAALASDCEKCAPGSYNNADGLTTCSSCLTGEFQDQYGKTSCNTCPTGYYCPSIALAPIACAEGFYCGSGAILQSPCTTAGTYSPSASSVCLDCEAGYACPTAKASDKIKCQVGYYSFSKYIACLPCTNDMAIKSVCLYNDNCFVLCNGLCGLRDDRTMCNDCATGVPNIDKSLSSGSFYQCACSSVSVLIKNKCWLYNCHILCSQYCLYTNSATTCQACSNRANVIAQNNYDDTFTCSCSPGTSLIDGLCSLSLSLCDPGCIKGCTKANSNYHCVACASGYYSFKQPTGEYLCLKCQPDEVGDEGICKKIFQYGCHPLCNNCVEANRADKCFSCSQTLSHVAIEMNASSPYLVNCKCQEPTIYENGHCIYSDPQNCHQLCNFKCGELYDNTKCVQCRTLPNMVSARYTNEYFYNCTCKENTSIESGMCVLTMNCHPLCNGICTVYNDASSCLSCNINMTLLSSLKEPNIYSCSCLPSQVFDTTQCKDIITTPAGYCHELCTNGCTEPQNPMKCVKTCKIGINIVAKDVALSSGNLVSCMCKSPEMIYEDGACIYINNCSTSCKGKCFSKNDPYSCKVCRDNLLTIRNNINSSLACLCPISNNTKQPMQYINYTCKEPISNNSCYPLCSGGCFISQNSSSCVACKQHPNILAIQLDTNEISCSCIEGYTINSQGECIKSFTNCTSSFCEKCDATNRASCLECIKENHVVFYGGICQCDPEKNYEPLPDNTCYETQTPVQVAATVGAGSTAGFVGLFTIFVTIGGSAFWNMIVVGEELLLFSLIYIRFLPLELASFYRIVSVVSFGFFPDPFQLLFNEETAKYEKTNNQVDEEFQMHPSLQSNNFLMNSGPIFTVILLTILAILVMKLLAYKFQYFKDKTDNIAIHVILRSMNSYFLPLTLYACIQIKTLRKSYSTYTMISYFSAVVALGINISYLIFGFSFISQRQLFLKNEKIESIYGALYETSVNKTPQIYANLIQLVRIGLEIIVFVFLSPNAIIQSTCVSIIFGISLVWNLIYKPADGVYKKIITYSSSASFFVASCIYIASSFFDESVVDPARAKMCLFMVFVIFIGIIGLTFVVAIAEQLGIVKEMWKKRQERLRQNKYIVTQNTIEVINVAPKESGDLSSTKNAVNISSNEQEKVSMGI